MASTDVRCWAAKVPDDRVEADNPWRPLIRWVVLEAGDEEGDCLIHMPDEHAGRVWDDWFASRGDANEFAGGLGVSRTAWVPIGDLWEWPEAPGWPPPGWRPRGVDEALMDRRRTPWDAAMEFAGRAVDGLPASMPGDVGDELRRLLATGELRRLTAALTELAGGHDLDVEVPDAIGAVQRHAATALGTPPHLPV